MLVRELQVGEELVLEEEVSLTVLAIEPNTVVFALSGTDIDQVLLVDVPEERQPRRSERISRVRSN